MYLNHFYNFIKYLILVIFIECVIIICINSSLFASQYDTLVAEESEVKVTLLYKFIKFIEWPKKVFLEDSDAFNFCILGENPFGDALDLIKGKKVDHKTMVIQKCHDLEEVDKCHILYISSSEENRLMDILKSINGLSILTVGDMRKFSQNGGIINFYMENDTVRFEINIDAVNRSGLNISSKLLRLAKIIRD